MKTTVSLKNTIIICLFVISTVAFLQCAGQKEILGQREFKRSTNDAGTSETSTDKFLAGENTSVWLATKSTNGPTFRRYDIPGYSQQSVVEEAVERYFNFKNNMDFQYEEPSWRIQGYTLAARAEWNRKENNIDAVCTQQYKLTHEQWTADKNLENIIVSMLVILDFQELQKITATNALDEVAKRITYVLAFWNMVNIKVNNLIKPTKVTIRTAGIILAETPNAFEAWTGTWKPTLQDTLNGMKDSFDDPTWTNQFPRDSYDFVAFMTSASVGGRSPHLPQGASSWRVPCTDDNHPIGDIMIWDNFSFTGLDGAVQELINVLGPKELDHRIDLIPRTSWTISTDLKPDQCAVRRVSDFLPVVSCLSTPKEYFPPGKPVRSILPGEMMTIGQYCGAHGYTQKEDSSRLADDCTQLECGYYNGWWRWVNMGRALDGMSCSSSDSMVCVEGGQCVSNDSKSIEANRFSPAKDSRTILI